MSPLSTLLFLAQAWLALAASLPAWGMVATTAPGTSNSNSNNMHSSCRCFPGDACWPTTADWAAFNATVGGRLVATVPIASACHYDKFAAYDADACAALQAVWDYPQTHYVTSSSPMAPWFANASCDPFTPPSAQCVVGAYVQYAVNATGVADYQATLAFAAERNIRLVIRNTGHDYFGKSTGAGALALWTHFLKDTTVIPNYESAAYSGPAMQLGAGVQIMDAFAAADAAGLAVVGGDCITVGVVGGYSQGGGLGPLSSLYGLGADQVLEWEVVTASGAHMVASPTQNEDLYWALSGGGGGTYAAVLSATVRAFPTMKVASANLTFTGAGVSEEAFSQAVQTYLTTLPALADAGTWGSFLMAAGYFTVNPVFGPDVSKAALQALMEPTLAVLEDNGISYEYVIEEFDDFLTAYNTMMPLNNITEYNIGGRLIPRSLFANNNFTESLLSAFNFIINSGGVVSGIVSNQSGFPLGGIQNSVNTVFRNSLIDVVIGLPYNTTDFEANIPLQQQMTNSLVPRLEAITPGGGAYLNEADFRQPDWQQTFYGTNYAALKAVKDKYDPYSLFYALTAVGSDEWIVESDGRLCQVPF